MNDTDSSASASVLDRRRAGVLLHVGSLPDLQGEGVLGAAAHRFVDLLADSGFSVWQMLPVGPEGDDDSPYFSASAHAGNPRFVDRAGRVVPESAREELAAFVERERGWLFDDGLFFALRAEQRGRSWWAWPAPLRDREAGALAQARARHREAIDRFVLEQFAFYRQWEALRAHARARGVQLFGDIPIYVAHDSAHVWTHRGDFQLDEAGRPTAVSGVPPDYFSADGQLWGNPLYDWPRLQADGFSSWVERFRTQLARFDLVRIDHFRGLEAYWSVPAGAPNARGGQWIPAPGEALLLRLREAFGCLPLVAEDLGVITPEVEALRDRFGLPGMRVLQFAFDGSPDNPHLPANHVRNSIAYTGTHDNDTTVGWYGSLDEHTRHNVHRILGCAPEEVLQAMIRTAMDSVADMAVIPLQDLLALGPEARMNTPGTTLGNWRWGFDWGQVPEDFRARWLALNRACGRSVGLQPCVSSSARRATDR
jgi:4-alpha-glucanotransferase